MDSSVKILLVITMVLGISIPFIMLTTHEQNFQKINSIAYDTIIDNLNPETVLEGKQYLNISDFMDVKFVEYHQFKSFFNWEDNKTIIYTDSNLIFYRTEDTTYIGYQFEFERKMGSIFREYQWRNPINQELVSID